ncbi:MAG: GNAT family N-acetyltransferase [Cyanobacteria bacterium P01_C01_bin.89]
MLPPTHTALTAVDLTVSEQTAAAQVLGQAFAKDPFMAHVFPDPSTRVQHLTALFLPAVRHSLHHDGIEMTADGKALALWVPGDAVHFNPLQLIQEGAIWLPGTIGWSAFKRFYGHDMACEQILQSHAPENFAYLWVLGVHPDAKGQGFGKRVLRSAMEAMRRRGFSSCFLRTENPNNVGMYQHFGFQQVLTATPAVSGHQYWLMAQDL